LIKAKKPLVHGNDRPGYCELEQNIKGSKMVMETGAGYFVKDRIKDGDILQGFYGGVPSGFGDPLKRDPALAKKDLDNGYLSIESCRRMHGIEADYDAKAEEWIIDQGKTARLREAKRKERLARGIPAKEWYRQRRQDLLAGKMPLLLRKMYNDSLTKGTRWSEEYRGFWGMGKDFQYKES
jgi:acetone carboxylase alpha subunit